MLSLFELARKVVNVDASFFLAGWIPLMMPFGLADTFSSTLDIPTLYNTVRISGREMTKNLLLRKI